MNLLKSFTNLQYWLKGLIIGVIFIITISFLFLLWPITLPQLLDPLVIPGYLIYGKIYASLNNAVFSRDVITTNNLTPFYWLIFIPNLIIYGLIGVIISYVFKRINRIVSSKP